MHSNIRRAEKPMRDLEEVMLEEQRLAADDAAKANEVAAASAAQEAAVPATAAAFPAGSSSDVSEIVEVLEGVSPRGLGAAVNKDDAMQLCSTVELTDLFAEYYQADVDDPDYLVNVESLNEDIDYDHAALTSANAAAAVPANTRATLGDNTEDFSLADMISVD